MAVITLALSGCGLLRGCTSSKPPIHVNPSMDDQPKVLPQAESAFFYDGSGMRKPVEGTVARGELREDDAFFKGLGPDGKPVATIPVAVDDKLLARGAARYAIYCQPCHGAQADGNGGITKKLGMTTVANLMDPRIVKLADGELFQTITAGKATMQGYAGQIPVEDRWAIIAYVRALHLSRLAYEADLPAPELEKLKK